jgi:hypothetical protein
VSDTRKSASMVLYLFQNQRLPQGPMWVPLRLERVLQAYKGEDFVERECGIVRRASR